MATKFSDPRVKLAALGLAASEWQYAVLTGSQDWDNLYCGRLLQKLTVAGFKVAITGPNARISAPVATYPDDRIGSELLKHRLEILPWEFIDITKVDDVEGVPILRCRIRREGFSTVDYKHLKIPDEKPRNLWVVGRLDVDVMNEWGFSSRVTRTEQKARTIAGIVSDAAKKKDNAKAKAEARARKTAEKVAETINEDAAALLNSLEF